MFAKLKSIREEQESGFTLIELLVVILIIGILAAIAIPMFLNQRKSAVDAQVQSDVKNTATQIETWAVSNPNASAVPGASSANYILAVGSSTGTTVTATGTGVTTAPIANAKLSNGTNIRVESTAVGLYTLCAWNKSGDQSGWDGVNATSGGVFIYDSNAGGLKASNISVASTKAICS